MDDAVMNLDQDSMFLNDLFGDGLDNDPVLGSEAQIPATSNLEAMARSEFDVPDDDAGDAGGSMDGMASAMTGHGGMGGQSQVQNQQGPPAGGGGGRGGRPPSSRGGGGRRGGGRGAGGAQAAAAAAMKPDDQGDPNMQQAKMQGGRGAAPPQGGPMGQGMQGMPGGGPMGGYPPSNGAYPRHAMAGHGPPQGAMMQGGGPPPGQGMPPHMAGPHHHHQQGAP
eukprot:CAMPEP_0177714800 /NCGR_PEP_ID=MMETSP0484_2-20121128/13643_1 /TAXON_ID=354590 /ORGANISM="Rhodomonas lens, Strain RHODO" /LENGTH=222 /DNA_ID=CAMNT_0019226735 /DNA_START=344 /DNA_END=1009 /DNA_ORIENTATION=+